MRIKRIIIGLVLTVIALPVVLVVIVVGTFYAYVYFVPRANGAIVSSGQRREYLLYVPKSYNRAKPTPLVISLHPAAAWPATQAEISQWNKVADEYGFIVVYPEGTTFIGGGDSGVLPNAWYLRRGADLWNARFISDLIDTLRAAYNIDPARIYADGMSNGGGMAFVLSCMLPDRIAAVGMVAAAQLTPWSMCRDHRPFPMVAFHGTDDPLVPYQGGPSGDKLNPVTFPAVRDWTATWAGKNRCAPQPRESPVASDITRLEYTGCAEDAAVVLYTIRGGGHTWPGGKPLPEWPFGRTTRSIEASRVMWAFFREHPLRGN